jgi:hypothetical protein
MSNKSLVNSPSRASNVKRKMPESFYRPPVFKTQLFSGSIESQRIIHHAHTSSLPVEVPNAPINLTLAQSVNNLNVTQPNFINPVNKPDSLYLKNIVSAESNGSNNAIYASIAPKAIASQQYLTPQHVKTYSLPVSFDPTTSNSSGNSGMEPPPSRVYNKNGDIPLPPGWDYQKTATGQVYYIK